MELELERAADCLIVVLHGEVDHHAAAKIRAQADAAAELLKLRHMILVLEDVPFMDSAGIGMVVGRYNKRKAAGGRLFLAGGSDSVRRILHMAGIDTLVPHYQTKKEAMEVLVSKDLPRAAAAVAAESREEETEQAGMCNSGDFKERMERA